MVSKNRYYRCSKISKAEFKQLARCFAPDSTAMSTAELTGLSVRVVNSIDLKIRVRIAESCELDSPWQGEVELDESYTSVRIAFEASGTTGLQQDDGVRVAQAPRQGLYRDRAPLLQDHTPRHYPHSCGTHTAIHSDGWRGWWTSGLIGPSRCIMVSDLSTASKLYSS